MIPLSTTTITILRPDTAEDPYDTPSASTSFAAGVRAHISSPSGSEAAVGGEQSVVEPRLDCDPVDLRHTDRVVDDNTGTVYEVAWVMARQGLGLDHVEAGLRIVTGLA